MIALICLSIINSLTPAHLPNLGQISAVPESLDPETAHFQDGHLSEDGSILWFTADMYGPRMSFYNLQNGTQFKPSFFKGSSELYRGIYWDQEWSGFQPVVILNKRDWIYGGTTWRETWPTRTMTTVAATWDQTNKKGAPLKITQFETRDEVPYLPDSWRYHNGVLTEVKAQRVANRFLFWRETIGLKSGNVTLKSIGSAPSRYHGTRLGLKSVSYDGQEALFAEFNGSYACWSHGKMVNSDYYTKFWRGMDLVTVPGKICRMQNGHERLITDKYEWVGNNSQQTRALNRNKATNQVYLLTFK